MLLRSLVLVAVAILSLGATTAGAQTVISSVPYAINTPGKYVLGNSLTTAAINQNAITVNAANVVLDLNGFVLSGPAGGTSSNASAISVGNVSNVTIRNGTLTNNCYGIAFNGGASARSYLVENVIILKCYFVGMYFGSLAPGSVVRNNSVSGIGGFTGTTNFNALGIYSIGGVSIENNHFATITGGGTGTSTGIVAGATDFVVGNKISNCTVGITMGGGTKFLNNLTANCTTPFSGGTNATGNN